MVEAPAEALHAVLGHRDSDARLHGRGQVGLHAALGHARQADAGRVHVVAGTEVVQQAHDVPDRVVKERMPLSGPERRHHRVRVGIARGPGRNPFAVETPVGGHGHEAAPRELLQAGHRAVLAAAGAVQVHDDRTASGRALGPHDQGRRSFTRLDGVGDMLDREAFVVRPGLDLRRERHAGPVDHLQEPRPADGRIGQRGTGIGGGAESGRQVQQE